MIPSKCRQFNIKIYCLNSTKAVFLWRIYIVSAMCWNDVGGRVQVRLRDDVIKRYLFLFSQTQ